ncbi:hypothetical protein BOV90_06455 [Solemya velum gill symbiont]|uniref:HTH merR-type domain-containing protein n=1 Tax=Solemya velum gill symbiont TaxID=2340 RepID=A0A1T2FJY6_SOVGS|nr:hypothetical protein BOV88_00575 [Solemya velum gill symbiont]OOY38239.1 hypothetical protein BOV89_03505 [Solemya velum gill symbiont]OOY39988.1 hypothetical protein BOV90_06455 [Solemya velum gill symbiont]OOY43857.1 hypothetical protein BOV91_02870 [Solemya velum gill symbiont]OOY47413.1 hypothetical protein BOV92_01445 [Solemya velum gill symbiont]
MMRIGQLEKETNIPVETLRFWERQGLLTPARSGPGKYRNYSEEDVRRIRFILNAKSVGFTLSEISQLLQMKRPEASHTADDILQFAKTKLNAIQTKLSELGTMQNNLSRLIEECSYNSGSSDSCTIFDKLDDGIG